MITIIIISEGQHRLAIKPFLIAAIQPLGNLVPGIPSRQPLILNEGLKMKEDYYLCRTNSSESK